MSDMVLTSSQVEPAGTRDVPQAREDRDAVREAAVRAAADMDPARPPTRADLERRAAHLLDDLAVPRRFLGFGMVAVSNAFWTPQFEAIPFARRLLFLPCCLRDADACPGTFDAAGLHCAGCGRCVIGDLKETAEGLGYRVLVAEGTPAVVAELLECDADALLGVACLDSLEKAFRKVTDVGVPYVAVPLLRDGCVNTAVDLDRIAAYLRASRARPAVRPPTFAPLLREAVRMFDPDRLAGLIGTGPLPPGLVSATDTIAMDWLEAGGKRFRPFVTLAAYAVSRHGSPVLSDDADLHGLLPPAVRRLAVAIEVLHKASLVHDDIEDDDPFRYGRPTLHREHGVGPAINTGDYLIGLGYRLIAEQKDALGADCIADILAHLAAAHLELSRGQGAELLWRPAEPLRPIDVLAVYARKTAPAFETALFAGLRAAGAPIDRAALKRFAVYVGEAYQVLNDLDDWQTDDGNKVAAARDVLSERPTLLRAFAVEAGGADQLADAAGDPARLRSIYDDLAVFDKAEALVDKLRDRAADLADQATDLALRDLLRFLVRTVLPTP
jgi:geranylgeranyl pyrophosphate synthase